MERKLDQVASVELISQMIQQAKGSVTQETGNYFILWGYVCLIASLSNFIITQLILSGIIEQSSLGSYYAQPWIWIVAVLFGVVGHIILVKRERSISRVKTYIDYVSAGIWSGFGVAIFIICFLFFDKQYLLYPTILFIFTFSLYMSAVVCKFKELYISVGICICCIISYRFISELYYPLPYAVAMLFGNIVPGHFYKYKNSSKKNV